MENKKGMTANQIILGISFLTAFSLLAYFINGHFMQHTEFSALALDLNGDGVRISRLGQDGSVYWDVDADGFGEATSWVSQPDGLLARDTNENGVIDDQSELFGTKAADGFYALSTFDSNHDGRITPADAGYAKLKIWQDNHLGHSDGITQPDELKSLSEMRITQINLPGNFTRLYESFNWRILHSTFVINGATRRIEDAAIETDNTNSIDTRPYTFNPETLKLPEIRGYGIIPHFSIAMSRDPELKKQVQELDAVSLETIFSPGFDLQDKIEKIMFRWGGVEVTDSQARGPHVDARKLVFLEHLRDEPFVQADGVNREPMHYQGKMLTYAWSISYQSLMARMLLQMSGKELFSSVPEYSFVTDEFTGRWELDEPRVISLLAASPSKAILQRNWETILQIIKGISTDGAVSTKQLSTLHRLFAASDPSGELSYETLISKYACPMAPPVCP